MPTTRLFVAGALVAALSAALSACGPDRAGVTAGAATPAASHPAASSVPAASAAPAGSVARPTVGPRDVLGPRGLGTLQLGMTKAAAAATGELNQFNDNDCSLAPLRGRPASGESNDVIISPALGLVAMFVSDRRVRTPEGIKVGSTLSTIKGTYRDVRGPDAGTHGFVTATVPGNSSAHYQFKRAADLQTVTEVALIRSNQGCFD